MKAHVNGFTMAYDDVGSGPAVVLIHGFPLCRHMWRQQAKALVEAGYRAVLPDLRGFGESETSDGPYAMSVFADDIIALLDHLGIEKAAVAGMSMGGYILLDLLEHYPRRVAAAGFIVTRAGADDEAGKVRRTKLAHAVQETGPQVVTEAFESVLFAEATSIRQPELVAEVREWMAGTSRKGLEGALLAMRDRQDYSGVLGAFDLPALVVRGEDDRLVPRSDAESLAKELPRATLCAIPGGGHLANLEQPDSFNRCLLRFLHKVLPPGTEGASSATPDRRD